MAILSYFPKEIGALVQFNLDQAKKAEAAMFCSIDWEGANYPCTAGPLREGKELDIGGWKLFKKCRIRVRIDALPDPTDLPKTNDLVTVYLSAGSVGTQMKILWTENTFDAVLEIEAVHTNHQ